MPVYLRTGGYKIYFWSNENEEPIHFHATKGNPSKDDTKIWALSNGSLYTKIFFLRAIFFRYFYFAF